MSAHSPPIIAYSASAKELVDNLVSALLINPWELTYAKSLQK
jgi:hypothetical protein